MADERPDDRSGRERPESSGTPGGPARDEGQARRSGRHRGFRGRHFGRPSGTEQSANGPPPGSREGGRQPREEQGQKPRGLRPEETSRQSAARDMPACPLCGKPVYDLSTAISASRETGEPAHFDCVLERVVASESIAADEKLVYLGSGSFGVVEFKDNKSESAFSVKRRIQWEKEGEKKDWRKVISSRISNL